VGGGEGLPARPFDGVVPRSCEPEPPAGAEVVGWDEEVGLRTAAGANGAVRRPGAGACCCTRRGAARTVVREPLTASGSDSGGESEPSVTSAGSVTAAARAVPATAAAAMIARLLLTSSPCSADPLPNGIGDICRQPKL
jgi:hypothetical protein